MAETLQDLKVKIKLDNKEFNSAINETKNSVSSCASDMTSKLKGLATAIAGCFAVKAVVNFGKEALNAAANLEEMENKFSVVFKNTGDSMTAWANQYADSIGRSSTEIREAISNQADLMIGMGMTEEVAGDLSKKYTELAYDLGSFNNVNDATALEAMTKAMFGETEMAKQLGLNLSATTMENSEYVKSLGKKWSALTQAEKAEAYYQEALKQSVNAIGDAERSSGSYTNQMKRLESAKTRLYEVIGTQLLPIFTPLVTAMGDIVTKASSFIDTFFGAYNETKSLSEALQSMGVETSGLEAIWQSFSDAMNIIYTNVISPVMEAIKEAFYMLYDAFREIMPTIERTFTDAWDNMILTAEFFGEVFNDAWETMLKPVLDFFIEIVLTLQEVFADVMPEIQSLWETVLEALSLVYAEFLKPTFEFIFELVKKMWDRFAEYLPQIQAIFTDVVDTIKACWENNLKPAFEAICYLLENVLYPAFSLVFEYLILPCIEAVFQSIIGLWNDMLKPVFEGITEFIKGVFTGNWETAWNGVVKIFDGIFGGLVRIAKTPINAVINMVNAMIRGLNRIKLPDWVPGLGGKGINIPQIPTLWKGSNFTLGGPTLVGEQGPELVNMPRGAQVLPAHKTKQALENNASSSNSITLKIENFYNNTEQDIESLADELAYLIRRKQFSLGGV